MATDFNFQVDYDKVKCMEGITAKIRYASKPANAKIMQEGNLYKIIFEEPQRAITSGQSVVSATI